LLLAHLTPTEMPLLLLLLLAAVVLGVVIGLRLRGAQEDPKGKRWGSG